MLSGTFGVLGIFLFRETYAPVIINRKTARLQKETGNMELRSKLDVGLSPKDFFLHSIVRPAKLLFMSPIVLFLSLFVGVVYGYLYLLFTTFTTVFEDTYDFSTGSVGLTFLGLGIGSLGGMAYFAYTSDRQFKKAQKAAEDAQATSGEDQNENTSTNSMLVKPEGRISMLLPAYALIPIGLFIYGVSVVLLSEITCQLM